MRAVTIEVGAENSVGACDLKTAPVCAHFSCPAGYGMGDELADIEDMGGCKKASLGVGGLA